MANFETLLSKATWVLLLQLGVWVLLRMLRLGLRVVIERTLRTEGKEEAQKLREIIMPLMSILSWVSLLGWLVSALLTRRESAMAARVGSFKVAFV